MRGRSWGAPASLPLFQRLRWPRGRTERAQRSPAPPVDTGALDRSEQALVELEKQISRVSREQFKARTLAEAQLEQFSAALEMLRASDARREAEAAAALTRSRADQVAARLDVAQSILPALDGLDEALRSGRRLLEQHTEPSHPSSPLGRLRARLLPPRRADTALYEAMEAWLVGLTFVRQRLLDVLAAEGVHPIAAQGKPFDPHYHVALEVVPSDDTVPPGSVIAELRRGYLASDRVLRYAEVKVAAEKST